MVYKHRIRLKEFFSDFDKLRCGDITQTQFKSSLSMAGMKLTAAEMEDLVREFKKPDDCQQRVCYREFCQDIDKVFASPCLETRPLELVSSAPTDLLQPSRFGEMPPKELDDDKEELVAELLENLQYHCHIRRILVKPFFDDACRSQNSPMMVNHVTHIQFKQALKNHIAPDLVDNAVNLLIEKFDDEMGMVNYVAFASMIDPPEQKYDAYSLH